MSQSCLEGDLHANVHGHELGGEVAEDEGNCDGVDAVRALANLTVHRQATRHHRLRHGREDGSTVRADVRLAVIRAVHEAVLEEEGDTVGEEGVTFHLSEPDATGTFATLYRLVCQVVNGAGGAHLELV